jgi:hypothetical protein
MGGKAALAGWRGRGVPRSAILANTVSRVARPRSLRRANPLRLCFYSVWGEAKPIGATSRDVSYWLCGETSVACDEPPGFGDIREEVRRWLGDSHGVLLADFLISFALIAAFLPAI